MFWEIKSIHALLDLLKGHDDAILILLFLGGVMLWKKVTQRLNGKEKTLPPGDGESCHQHLALINGNTMHIAVLENDVKNVYSRLDDIHKAVLRIEDVQRNGRRRKEEQ